MLRVKAFKILYSYAENPGMTLKEALAALDTSCEATRDLSVYLLSIVIPLTAEAARQAEALRLTPAGGRSGLYEIPGAQETFLGPGRRPDPPHPGCGQVASLFRGLSGGSGNLPGTGRQTVQEDL